MSKEFRVITTKIVKCDRCNKECTDESLCITRVTKDDPNTGDILERFDMCDSCANELVNWAKTKPVVEAPKENKWEVFDKFIGREWLVTPVGIQLNRTSCRRIASMLGLKSPREVSDHLDEFEAQALENARLYSKPSSGSLSS